MSFESGKFESGVSKTMSSLDKLKKSLNFGGGKGLEGLSSAASSVNLSPLSQGIEGLKGKFSAFRLVAIGAMANVASQAVSAGLKFVKSFTLDPIKAGFDTYETQVNATKTIMANTGLTGKAGLDKVSGALGNLNTYANKTVYNFGEMAHNIGTFTAAGVNLPTAVSSIKGIANLAALSGSSSQQ